MSPDASCRRPAVETPVAPHHRNCMGCGPENPAGLHLRMSHQGGRVRGELVLDARHEGSPGLAHGGAVATALDDLLGGVLVMLGRPAVTAKLTVDYRAPVLLGEPLALLGWADHIEGRKLHLQATMHGGGRLLAEAHALFIEVALEHFAVGGRGLPPDFTSFAPGHAAVPPPGGAVDGEAP